MAPRLAAPRCALCVLVLPSPSVDPTARSDGFVSSAQQDRMMKTLAPAAPLVLAAGAQWRAQRSIQLALRPGLRSLFSQRMPVPIALDILLCGPKPTQPPQPGVAPNLAATLVVKYTRRCPDGPWSCCVTIAAFQVSALPFQGSPRTFFNSLITNLS